ncbi:MAG TPA: fasciclin domain-containing protein [Methanothrix sp.]|nr:fasciclin domain-containing protein [Methanothrix sp.]
MALLALLHLGLCAAGSSEAGRYSVEDALKNAGATKFSAALEQAHMNETLNNQGVLIVGNGSFVIFAPDDAAFANATGIDISALSENQTELKGFLSYHVVWNDGLFSNISQLSSVQTLQGENLTLESGGPNNISNLNNSRLENMSALLVNGARVLSSKRYDNGTVYVINKVLVPKNLEVLGVIEASGELGAKKFAEDLRSVDMAEMLNGQGPAGIESLSEGPFTVFAPTDEAFSKVSKGTMDSISKKEGGLRSLLSYHVIDAKALFNRTDRGSAKTLAGGSLAFDEITGMVSSARVLKSKRYENGIIYLIDQVLVPIGLN